MDQVTTLLKGTIKKIYSNKVQTYSSRGLPKHVTSILGLGTDWSGILAAGPEKAGN